MLFIVLSGLFGAVASFFLMLWPCGPVIACFGAVLGGSIFAGLAALWLGHTSLENVPALSGKSQTKVNSLPE
jgi:hypothetical protein